MNTLYYAPGACSLAPHVVLEWIGEPYEAVRVDQHDPAFKAINPAGAVPALNHDGELPPLTQAAAILKYLGHTHPAADLLGDGDPESEAELDRWSAFLTGDLHPAFFPIFFPTRYTASRDPGALKDVKAGGKALVATKLRLLEQHLQGRTWTVGNRRTIIDAYVTPMLNWAAEMLSGGLTEFPAVAAHHGRMLADPVVARIMLEESAAAA